MLEEIKKANIQERLAHLLRSHRQERNLTQSELAKNLSVTVSLIAKFENPKNTKNRAISSYEFFHDIGEQVDLSVTELISYLQNGGVEDSPYTQNMMDTFSHLRADIQYLVLKYFANSSKEKIDSDFGFFFEIMQSDPETIHFMKDTWARIRGKK